MMSNDNTFKNTMVAVRIYQEWQMLRYSDETPLEDLERPKFLERFKLFVMQVHALRLA